VSKTVAIGNPSGTGIGGSPEALQRRADNTMNYEDNLVSGELCVLVNVDEYKCVDQGEESLRTWRAVERLKRRVNEM